MGTWGTGNLSNDTALDWFGAFSDNPDAEMIRETFEEVLQEEYLDAEVSCAALAAAETLAALKGQPGPDFDETQQGLLSSVKGMADLPLLELSILTIDRIMLPEDNELYELWKEVSSEGEWLQVVKDLRQRLQHVVNIALS